MPTTGDTRLVTSWNRALPPTMRQLVSRPIGTPLNDTVDPWEDGGGLFVGMDWLADLDHV
jgi:hypothetical protein